MITDKLNKWADLLLDTGKRNNLINFKDSKMGSVEIVSPDIDTIFSKIEHSTNFEVFNPKFEDDEENEIDKDLDILNGDKKYISKDDYIKMYEHRLKKKSQLLIYNTFSNPIKTLQNIEKKAKSAIEETGVNIAYIAFGFINWKENENSQYIMHAPILLVPISIENDSELNPYNIRITDNDIIVNPTFSFKLKNDYGFELPNYEDETIGDYLEKVSVCLSKLKWTITKECKIGIFSFLKINMYNDLKDNATKILNNRSVCTLLGEHIGFISENNDANKLTDNSLNQLHNVVDADNSQIEAIEMALSGRNFVLQGPPGTGKSQTITNIIAECLANGKKVLFVSEKLAALNVVYDKLKKAGLEEFCLELHSHKANKKDVINELYNTLNAEKKELSNRANKEIEEKIRTQKDLDKYAIELHKVRPVINKTLYRLYEEVSTYRKVRDIEFIINDIKSKGEIYISKAEIALNRYVSYVPSISYDYHQNIWYGYVDIDSSYQTVIQLKRDLKDSITLFDNIKILNENLSNKYSIFAENIIQAYALKDFFKLIKESDFITPALLNSSTLEIVLKNIKEMNILSKEILEYKKDIENIFDEDIYKIDGNTYYKKLTKQFNGFFSRFFSSEYKNIAKNLRLCKKNGKKLKYEEAVSIMNKLCIYQQQICKFNKFEEKINDKIGVAYNNIYTNFESLINELEILTKIIETDVNFAALTTLTNPNFFSKQREFEKFSECFENSFNKLDWAEKRVRDKYNFDEYDIRYISLEDLKNKYQGCLDNIDKLDNWCEFIKLLNNLNDLGLRPFVDYSITQKIKISDFIPVYKKTFYTQWIDVLLQESPFLKEFSRIPHDETVKLFKNKDKISFEINKNIIKAKLTNLRPDLNEPLEGSPFYTLQRESKKKRNQKSIRLLLEEIGELGQTLKPCFLMSPLSVSTFLSSDIKFDVVIFDEASQIFPQDAIGAIYRGKQIIVVGDSKQMPPSNFFNSTTFQDYNESESDDVTDFESILDICSTVFPQKRLKWHYRSRFESLISFSNKNFYDNDLITFPSSKQDTRGIGVDYFYVGGIFDHKTKTNRIEAEKIVDLVFENIEKYPERSLGVVAFSMSQQNLIDKLLSKRRQQDPSKESFFKLDKAEPFFIKNLETVQGDERDTIIFSIAYGKDSQDKLLLNFGPINREGGERRLNVAFTRAKYNIQLVSSMHYTDIDLSRTQSVGVRLLREYLDYAENGVIALERAVSINSYDNFDSEFEMEVCEFLRDNGFCVDTQVGCSSFRIDLALKHPNTSDYLLAIECDGASYHSSKSARDRDRLRQEILERMGWKFYRIWSTDWFRNKKIEKERLLEVVKNAVNNVNFKPKEDEAILNNISFEEVVNIKHFEFPEYVMVNVSKTAKECNYYKIEVISKIVQVESPLSEEWLLKRILFLFNREKITSVVHNEYNDIMRNCSKYKIIRKNGFLYLQDKEIPMLRIPKTDTVNKRDVKYISLEELAQGIKEIIRQNVSVEKSALYRYLIQKLGFSRMNDSILEHFEASLCLIEREINIDNDILSLKNN